MRLLNPEDIDQLITVSGMIIRTSAIIPEMRQAYFECHICQKGVTGLVERGRVTEPSVCPGCQTLHSMQLIHNRSIFSDKQMLKLQEAPDDMPPGQTPHTIALYAHNDLVDTVQPGDKVCIRLVVNSLYGLVNALKCYNCLVSSYRHLQSCASASEPQDS